MAIWRLTSFIKFNVDRIIPKPSGMNLASIFQLSTFIGQLMILVKHALLNEEPTRKIKLGENIWFITEILSVDKNATFLLLTIKFNYHSVHFLQTVTCFKIPKQSPGGVLLKKVSSEIWKNLQENTCARVFFLIKLQALACNVTKKETLAQVFSCEFCEISKNAFSYRTLLDVCFWRS